MFFINIWKIKTEQRLSKKIITTYFKVIKICKKSLLDNRNDFSTN